MNNPGAMEQNLDDTETFEVTEEHSESRNSDSPSSKAKKNACVYCFKLFSKITPHLEKAHKDKVDVQKFTVLPKGCKERKKIIETLRRGGNFQYGLQHKGDAKIACRRERKGREGKVNLMACHHCKGYFSSLSLRHHVRKCVHKIDSKKNIKVLSRKLDWDVHTDACEVLKKDVLPILRTDPITDLVKYDSFLISYGNRMCVKYRSSHHHSMIRARLRSLARLLFEIKKDRDEIQEFNDIFDPIYYDAIINCINLIGKLDETTGKYGAPSTAFNLGITLKYCIRMKISQCIRSGNVIEKKKSQDLLQLMTEDISTSVNKTVSETQGDMKRRKKVTLPLKEDIQSLNNFLIKQRRNFHLHLEKKGFSFLKWKDLASYILISIQLFNRRRAGEIERMSILDYRNYQTINENTDPDIFKTLSEESQKAVQQYGRVSVRGKLGKEVPVLMHKEIMIMLDYVINHRSEAGVLDENPYVFGLPGNSQKYLRACVLLREYSKLCGAKNPATLRGTELRKHIATRSVVYDLQESEVRDLASFLGHELAIHKQYYRLPILTIAQMSKLLEKAQGCDDIENGNENQGVNVNPELPVPNEFDGSLVSQARGTRGPSHPHLDTGCLLSEVQEETFEVQSQETENSTLRAWSPIPCSSKHDDSTTLTRVDAGTTHMVSNTNIIKPCTVLLTPCFPHVKRRLFDPDTHSLKTRSRTPFLNVVEDRYSTSNSAESEVEEYQTTTAIKRTSWTTPERRRGKQLLLECGKLPSLSRCQDYIAQYPELKNRTVAQLKAWVNNQFVHEKQQLRTPDKRIFKGRATWITPERHIIKTEFGRHIRASILPSLQECDKVLKKYPEILRKRNPTTIKAKVNNEIKRKSLKV